MIPKIVFCPKCKRPFKPDDNILELIKKVKAEKGISIACVYKEAKSKNKCTGKVKLKTEKQEA